MTDEPTILFPHTLGPDRLDGLSEILDDDLPEGAIRIARTPEETFAAAPEVEAIVAGHLGEELLDAAERLRWVQALSAGVDHYDLDELAERGIVLTNASGVHAQPIAEQVLCYALMFERGLHESVRQQARGVWERVEGGEIRGKTMGIVGVGAIGARTADLASALGMEVIGTKRDVESAPDVLSNCYPADEHHELCRRSDYLVLACPLTDETEGLLGYEEFRMMPSSAVVINIARGAVADEAALTRALQSKWIRGAALDVFETEPLPRESPLWELSNVVITPHMAGSTPEKFGRWREIVAENYRALAEGRSEAMVNRVV